MRRIFLAVFILFFCFEANAQIKQANSPYSYFGIGDLEPGTFLANRALAGYGTALRVPLNININNPAALSSLRRTTFETAMDFNSIRLSTEEANQNMSDVGIGHLAIGAPIKNFGGAAFAFQPYSSVYYQITNSSTVDGVGNVEIQYEGEGTIYQFYFGNGYTYKFISLGFDVSYLFGTVSNKTSARFPDLEGTHPYQITKTRNTGGWLWNVGFQIHPMITEKVQMIVGGTYRSATKLNMKNEKTIERVPISFSGVTLNDDEPFFDTGISEGHVDLPSTISLGVGFKKSTNWQVGVDYKFENWAKTNIENQNATFSNRYTVSVGAAIIPWKEGLKKFLNTTQYRFGFYTGSEYFKPYNQSINRLGFTMGAGFPLGKRGTSTLNLSFDVGQRGTTNNGLIKENYFKTSIGVTLNDLWFIKPKFD